MSTTIDNNTKTRLQWLAGELRKLYDNGWLRYDGEPVFRGAQQELDDIIGTAQAPADVAPTIVQTVMSEEQIERVLSAIPAGVEAAVAVHLEQSDVAIMAALAGTRADLLGRLDSLAAPAVLAA